MYEWRIFQDAIRYGWYLASVLLGVLVSLLAVDQCVDRVNLRPYAMVIFMVFNLTQISLIIYCISFYQQLEHLRDQVKVMSGCFLGSWRTELGQMGAQMQYGM